MLILLPPSEGKADAGSGAPLDPASLSLPGLRRARDRVLRALVKLCGAKSKAGQQRALETLGLSEGQRGELARNAELATTATLPAAQLYTGVLYDALDLASLAPEAAAAATESILISSGLWGAARLDDRIPPYRCSIGVTLPAVGGLTAYWKKALEPVLARTAGEGLVLDLRSGAYAATWTPRGEQAERTAQVRVLHEREAGGTVRRTVVSHFNKATKGRLVRDLLAAGARPGSPAELAIALSDLKYTVEQVPAAPGRPRQLDVIVREL
jgi:cytoplasmic iron level regulating protein YaaA (DUF328/UPF0246 family)